MTTSIVIPSQIAAELAIVSRLEREFHAVAAASNLTAHGECARWCHLVTDEVNRRIGRVEGALNFRVPLPLDTGCARCLTILALKREFRNRVRSRVLVDSRRHRR